MYMNVQLEEWKSSPRINPELNILQQPFPELLAYLCVQGLDPLGLIGLTDKRRLGCVDHHHVVAADRRDQVVRIAAGDERVVRSEHQGFTARRGVARLVFRKRLPKRRPTPDIQPVQRHRHGQHLRTLVAAGGLHHGVVHADLVQRRLPR